MLNARQILVSVVGLGALVVGLGGCGQRGPLYLPTGPEAAQRATLPQLLIPGGAPAAQAPATPDPAQPAQPPKNTDAQKPANDGKTTGSRP